LSRSAAARVSWSRSAGVMTPAATAACTSSCGVRPAMAFVFCAARIFASTASAWMAASIAASMTASVSSRSADPTYVPAVSRSRVADGWISSFATSWPSRSDGTT
jgi:hypothetical protein